MEMKESENAKAVGLEVVSKVCNGKKVNFQEIQKKHGYSERSARAMKAKQTKTYKRTTKPFFEQLQREQQRLFNAIEKKDLTEMQYESAVRSLDILTKNIQLLSGGATEKIINVEVSQEIKDKYL